MSTPNQSRRYTVTGALGRHALAGILMFMALLAAVGAVLFPAIPTMVSGILAWSAALLLWPNVKFQQRLQSTIMLSLGAAGLLWASQFQALDWQAALTANRNLIAMLGAVTFLRLVATSTLRCGHTHPTGTHALVRTLLGVHLFGAVINYSAPSLMGERLSGGQGKPLHPAQAMVLSRGFAAAAFWSPFFVAMGVALTNAPGAELITVGLAGLPLAIAALLLSRHDLKQRTDLDQCEGYPMQTAALKVPAVLALTILVAHELFRELPVVTLITITSLVLTALLLVLKDRHSAVQQYKSHILTALPGMQSEVWLFLSAGVLATGIHAVVGVTEFELPLTHAGSLEISLYLLAGFTLAVLAIHPIIIIASAGSLLMPLVDSPNLLALAFLMTWALGVGGSPFSGLNLSMASRFHMNNFHFFRWNIGYSLKLYAVCVMALCLYDWAGWL